MVSPKSLGVLDCHVESGVKVEAVTVASAGVSSHVVSISLLGLGQVVDGPGRQVSPSGGPRVNIDPKVG